MPDASSLPVPGRPGIQIDPSGNTRDHPHIGEQVPPRLGSRALLYAGPSERKQTMTVIRLDSKVAVIVGATGRWEAMGEAALAGNRAALVLNSHAVEARCLRRGNEPTG